MGLADGNWTALGTALCMNIDSLRCVQETSAALICFLVEYHTSFEAPPISDDPDLMHRLTHNANSKRVGSFAYITFCLTNGPLAEQKQL